MAFSLPATLSRRRSAKTWAAGGGPLKKAALVALGLAAVYAAWIGLSLLFLPSVKALRSSRVSFTITVKDWNRKDRPFVVGPRNRYWTPYSSIPSSMRRAVIAAEDANFYRHEGVDYEALRAAIKTDIEKGRFARGGSTITQQVVKNIYLTREKSVSRKIKEIILAHRMDDVLTKSRILELYLNVAELGPMVYGIGHASRYYFGKHPAGLTVRESAFLAAMLPGPKVYNPYRRMDRVMRRADRILRRMHAARMITEWEYRFALIERPDLEGLARTKVEKTMASPLREEPPPPVPPAEALPAAGDEAAPASGPEAENVSAEVPGESPEPPAGGVPR